MLDFGINTFFPSSLKLFLISFKSFFVVFVLFIDSPDVVFILLVDSPSDVVFVVWSIFVLSTTSKNIVLIKSFDFSLLGKNTATPLQYFASPGNAFVFKLFVSNPNSDGI